MLRRLFILMIIWLMWMPLATAQPRQQIEPDFWGMVVRDPYYEWGTNPAFPDQINQTFINTMLDELQKMGVQWVRFEFHGQWGGGEYGSINLSQADYFVDAAHARGIKVVGLLGTDILKKSPPFLSTFDSGPYSCVPAPDPWGIGCAINPFIQAWLERALTIAQHYEGRIDAYEIFNEQNFYFALRNETNGTQDEMHPEIVARTITKFFRIIRTNGDSTPVLVGGLHPMRSVESGRTDRDYIHALYNSTAFKDYRTANARWPIDGIAYHPYPVEMRDLLSDNDFLYLIGPRLDQIITIIRSYDQTAKLWLTEIGTRGAPTSLVDMERQALFLKELVGIFRTRATNLGPWFWFKYEDFPGETWGIVHIPFDSQGRYDSNGTVTLYKPAYTQYRRMALDVQVQPRMWVPMMTK